MNRKQLILCLLTLLGSITAHAYDLDVNGVFYNITDADAKTVEVTYVEDGEGNADFYAGNITIPKRISTGGVTYTVTAIGEKAFNRCSNLTSVVIQEGITTIGNDAFFYCSGLTSLTIPEGVTSIGERAFFGCSGLATLTIPESVTSIGNSAFWGCSGLTSLTIPEGVTSIGSYAFSYCSGLTSLTIPEGVTSIGNSAFEYCSGLTSLTIPEGVTSIANYAFHGCSGLTSLTIPEGVTSIGEGAFYRCTDLTSLTIPESITSISNYAFAYCSGLTSLTIPEGVTSIGDFAFQGCSGLTSLTIPEGVTSIANYAFHGCSGLTSLTIPEGVTSIGEGAFYRCTDLTSLTIPESITSISNYAFAYCSGLTSLTIPEGVTSIGEGAFYLCTGLKALIDNNPTPQTLSSKVFDNTTCAIFVPTASLETYKTAEGWSAYADRIQPQTGWTFTAAVPCGEGTADLTFKVTNANPWEVEVSASPEDIAGALTIPATVTNENGIEFAVTVIGEEALKDRTAITSLSLSEGLTRINYNSLRNIGISSLVIPNSVTVIDHSVLCDCQNLESVTLSEYLTYIPAWGFAGCTSLKSISLPEGILKIDNNAFRGSGLESIKFPSTLTRVDVAAFRDCSALKTIDFNGCTATLEAEAFLGTAIEELVIPETVILKGWTNFGWCPELRSVEMKNINQTAHNGVFKACAKLETAILPKIAVMTTGYFENCTNLRSVTFLSGAPGNDGRQYCGKNFIDVPEDVLFIVPEGTAESYLKSGYKNLSDKSGLPLVREEFEAEAARITTMAEALNDGDKTALNTAITSARTTVNATDDYMTIYGQIAAIKTAARTFLTTATLPNGFDVTAAAITNPDFDRFQMGWKTIGGGEKRGWMGEPGYYHVENGDVILDYFIEAWNFQSSVNDGELSQTITSLPAGIYRLEADLIATNQDNAETAVTGVSLFAGGEKTAVATENQKPQHFSVKFENTVTKDVTIGVSISGTNANWVAMDNVRLIYEGKAADIPQGIDLASDENARVYLYNVETGKYLSAGHSWGTHAMLDETGLPVRLTQDAETGLWLVYFWEGSNSDQLLFRNYSDEKPEEVFVDYNHENSDADEDLTLWRITQTDDGSYLIQNKKYLDTEFYLGNIPTRQDDQDNYNGVSYTDIISKASVNDNSHWLIFTKENSDQLAAKSRLMATIIRMEESESVNEDLLATAQNTYNDADATVQEVIDITTQLNSQMGMPMENQPVEMTALINNPRFENNTTEGWSGANVVGGRADATSNHEQEFYQKNFDMYQTITGVPNGRYLLKWKGFHRPGERSAVFTEYTAGTDNASAVVYANSVQKTMKNIASEMSDTRLDDTDFEGNGRYYPYSMEGARKYFDAGYYADQLEVEVTDNVLTIGVKNTENMGNEHWVIFSDFELYIMENAEQVNNKLVASSGQGVNGGRATLPVNMTNGDDIAGIQFKVRLPEGMTMNTNASGQLKVTKTSRTSAMSLQASNRGDYYQVLMYSIDDAVSAGSGAIAKMEMNLAETLGLGDYNVDIYDVVLTKRDGLRIKPFSATGTMTIVDAQLGDANHDGDVDVADIISIANYILGSASGSFDMTAADVNGDGDVDVADIIGIANIILGGQSSQVKANVMDMQEETLLDPQ